MCEKKPASPSWADIVKPSATKPAQQVSAPLPRVQPKPVTPPPPIASAKPVASCSYADPDPIADGWPLGFENPQQYEECMEELYKACEASGIEVDYVGVRGSAATYHSGNPSKVGQRFDSRGPCTSDIDVFVVTDSFLDDPCRPNRDLFVHPDKIEQAYSAIADWNQEWSDKLGRPVAAAAFRPRSQKLREPKIVFEQ